MESFTESRVVDTVHQKHLMSFSPSMVLHNNSISVSEFAGTIGPHIMLFSMHPHASHATMILAYVTLSFCLRSPAYASSNSSIGSLSYPVRLQVGQRSSTCNRKMLCTYPENGTVTSCTFRSALPISSNWRGWWSSPDNRQPGGGGPSPSLGLLLGRGV